MLISKRLTLSVRLQLIARDVLGALLFKYYVFVYCTIHMYMISFIERPPHTHTSVLMRTIF